MALEPERRAELITYQAPSPTPAALLSESAAGQPLPETQDLESAAQDQRAVTIDSPMVGTFFRSPSPETDPYVEVGGNVGEGTILCIVEAMKIMNEIKAETRGEIIEILVENGQPVEYGQPMFRIIPE